MTSRAQAYAASSQKTGEVAVQQQGNLFLWTVFETKGTVRNVLANGTAPSQQRAMHDALRKAKQLGLTVEPAAMSSSDAPPPEARSVQPTNAMLTVLARNQTLVWISLGSTALKGRLISYDPTSKDLILKEDSGKTQKFNASSIKSLRFPGYSASGDNTASKRSASMAGSEDPGKRYDDQAAAYLEAAVKAMKRGDQQSATSNMEAATQSRVTAAMARKQAGFKASAAKSVSAANATAPGKRNSLGGSEKLYRALVQAQRKYGTQHELAKQAYSAYHSDMAAYNAANKKPVSAANDTASARYVFPDGQAANRFVQEVSKMGIKTGAQGNIAVAVKPGLRAADISDLARKLNGKPTTGAVQASTSSAPNLERAVRNVLGTTPEAKTAVKVLRERGEPGLLAWVKSNFGQAVATELKTAAAGYPAARELNGKPTTGAVQASSGDAAITKSEHDARMAKLPPLAVRALGFLRTGNRTVSELAERTGSTPADMLAALTAASKLGVGVSKNTMSDPKDPRFQLKGLRIRYEASSGDAAGDAKAKQAFSSAMSQLTQSLMGLNKPFSIALKASDDQAIDERAYTKIKSAWTQIKALTEQLDSLVG